MQNAQELLDRYCGIKLASVDNESAFLRKGPSFLMSYHPALGPFYSIIKQKIQGGRNPEWIGAATRNRRFRNEKPFSRWQLAYCCRRCHGT